MRFEADAVREAGKGLHDENYQHGAPDQVHTFYLAAIGPRLAEQEVVDYVIRQSGADGTRWVVLALCGRELIVIDGSSHSQYWSSEDEDKEATVSASVNSRDAVQSLEVVSAVDDARQSQYYSILSRWRLTLKDGRSFELPTVSDATHTRERAERFSAALRDFLVG